MKKMNICIQICIILGTWEPGSHMIPPHPPLPIHHALPTSPTLPYPNITPFPPPRPLPALP